VLWFLHTQGLGKRTIAKQTECWFLLTKGFEYFTEEKQELTLIRSSHAGKEQLVGGKVGTIIASITLDSRVRPRLILQTSLPKKTMRKDTTKTQPKSKPSRW
jgi:hypothetical protein